MKMTRVMPGLVLAAAATPALAHTGIGAVNSFAGGILHPFTGADHLLAMVAAGLWAALVAPRLFWVPPAGFMAGMLVGGVFGIAGVTAPGAEAMIVGSVVAFGLLAAFMVKAPAPLAFSGAALFGGFHGLAHGAEMPTDAAGLHYAAGFLIATAILHASGVGAGLVAQRFELHWAGRIAGALVAAAGGVMLAG